MRQYQKRIGLQLEKERLLAKRLLTDGKKEWVHYDSKVVVLSGVIQTRFRKHFRSSVCCFRPPAGVSDPSLCVFGRKALLLLKKKRYQEQLLDKTENQISNLETMVSHPGAPQTDGRPGTAAGP